MSEKLRNCIKISEGHWIGPIDQNLQNIVLLNNSKTA